MKRTRGMSVGVVTTAYMQDATPAAVWGHSRERNSRSRSDYALSLVGAHEYQNPFTVVFPEIILGGGARYILPNSVDGSRRPDDVDGFAAYEEAGYNIVTNATELNQAVGGNQPIIGVFANNNLDTWLDRNVFTDNLGDNTDQPGLVDMTTAALELLSTNENGFFLEVEAASVDKQLHPMDFERALADNIEFERAVAATVEWLEEVAELEAEIAGNETTIETLEADLAALQEELTAAEEAATDTSDADRIGELEDQIAELEGNLADAETAASDLQEQLDEANASIAGAEAAAETAEAAAAEAAESSGGGINAVLFIIGLLVALAGGWALERFVLSGQSS